MKLSSSSAAAFADVCQWQIKVNKVLAETKQQNILSLCFDQPSKGKILKADCGFQVFSIKSYNYFHTVGSTPDETNSKFMFKSFHYAACSRWTETEICANHIDNLRSYIMTTDYQQLSFHLNSRIIICERL